MPLPDMVISVDVVYGGTVVNTSGISTAVDKFTISVTPPNNAFPVSAPLTSSDGGVSVSANVGALPGGVGVTLPGDSPNGIYSISIADYFDTEPLGPGNGVLHNGGVTTYYGTFTINNPVSGGGGDGTGGTDPGGGGGTDPGGGGGPGDPAGGSPGGGGGDTPTMTDVPIGTSGSFNCLRIDKQEE